MGSAGMRPPVAFLGPLPSTTPVRLYMGGRTRGCVLEGSAHPGSTPPQLGASGRRQWQQAAANVLLLAAASSLSCLTPSPFPAMAAWCSSCMAFDARQVHTGRAMSIGGWCSRWECARGT